MKKIPYFSAIFFGILCSNSYADQYLCNYLGTGTEPAIAITLKNNGGKPWGSYSLGYGNCLNNKGAGIPTNPDLKNQWSYWEITDEKNHYYGAFTLNNDDKRVTIKDNGNDRNKDYQVTGLELKQAPKNPAQWIISATNIISVPDAGPFPTTPLATKPVNIDNGQPFRLNVAGTNIVDNEGNIVRLKGFARPSLEWDVKGDHLSEADFTNMKKWGANLIRLSLTEDYWLQSKDKTVKGSYKQIIDAMIYNATKNGMAVILDLHWTRAKGQPNMADKAAITFWQEVAQQYKDFGSVIFELFNEPVNINKEVWLHGDATYSGLQELYDAVRAIGAKNLCLVNGLQYGFDLSFVNAADQYKYALKGENIIYGAHPYQRRYEEIDKSLAGVVKKYPILFTEFGDNTKEDYPANYSPAYKNALQYIEDHALNYTAWAWWVELNKPEFPTLIADWETATPINGGVIVKENMAKFPVTPLPIMNE